MSETSLAALMKPKLKAAFPHMNIEYFDTADPFAVIAPMHPDWDAIELIDDKVEITIEFGKFTHVHYMGDFSGDITIAVMNEICDDVIDHLTYVFSDEQEFHTHGRGGGCRPRGSAPYHYDERVFLWSTGEQHRRSLEAK